MINFTKKRNSKMKKLIISTLAMALTIPVFGLERPDRNGNEDFENINEREEYRYDIKPGIVFWREGGRPYWRSEDFTIQANLLREKIFHSSAHLQATQKENVRFEMEQAKLDSSDRETLRKLATQLTDRQSGVEEVWIMGFASRPGPEEYNQSLSQKRANNVKKFLVGQGVDSSLIKTSAYGEAGALKSADASRRVEIKIMEI